MQGYYPVPEKLPALKARIRLRSLLDDWYGESRAALETHDRDRNVLKLDDVMRAQLRELCGGEAADFLEISGRFSELAGKQMAIILKPERLCGGVLFLKVRHSAFLGPELDKSADLLISRLNSVLGREVCRGIRFC